MLMTASPTADAERYFDGREAKGDALDAQDAAEARRLASAFVDAAEWGEAEPLEGRDVATALYEVGSTKPELIDAIFYWAARQTGDPVLRSMVQEVADEWASIKLRETQ